MTRRRGVPRQAYRAARASRTTPASPRRRRWDPAAGKEAQAKASRTPMEFRLLLARQELADFLTGDDRGDLVLALELLASCCPATGSVTGIDYGQLTG